MRPDPYKLSFPENSGKKVLIHACCAPCCGSIIKRLIGAGLEPTVFFCNPNIYPRDEYKKRKAEVVRYAEKLNIPCVDMDHDQELWFATVRGRENDPERGERCSLCFELRLGKTASYAGKEGFSVFTTSLAISRWKDRDQVMRAGLKAASLFPGITFWDMDWRKGGGTEMMAQITKEEKFYRQNYCGCIYSFENSLKKQMDYGENSPG